MLSLVADHDPLYQAEAEAVAMSRSYSSGHSEEDWDETEMQRPQTTDRDDPDGVDVTNYEQRPFTSARHKDERLQVTQSEPSQTVLSRGIEETLPSQHKATCSQLLVGQVVQLCLTESWGDPSYVGLTGVELLLTPAKEPLVLREDQLSGPATVERVSALVDGVNLTMDVENMCLCSTLHSSQPPTITVTLDTPTQLFGMRLWNYNTSLEDTYKGVSIPFILTDHSSFLRTV